MKKLLIVDVAGLDVDVANKLELNDVSGFGSLTPPFPAVTCTAQATFRTGLSASKHGMIANGYYDRSLEKTFFWEQSSSLVGGLRIWGEFRRAGNRVGMMFWQQSLGESVDLVLSPAPIHKHHGGMIMDCYSIPRDLYPMLCSRLGKFKLEHYWGPMASPKAGDWIASATAHVMANDGPELLFSYLPTLDYDFQRFGPGHPKAAGAINALASQINQLTAAAEEAGYDWLLWGDYSIVNVEEGPLFPNRLLADDGLLKTREVAGRSYPDFHASRAFAMVDHAVAHIYIKDHGCIQDVISLLGAMPGVEKMFGGSGAKEVESFHRRGGEIILLAEKGAWFAYPWWDDTRKAPDYATHVDIHNKPGFDPCELLFQWFPPGVTQNQDRIKGTHGRIDSSVAWSGSIEFEKRPTTLKELAEAVGGHLQKALSS